MTFANASQSPQEPTTSDEAPFTITQDWWPDIDVADARSVIRISGTVTQPRLVEALKNAVWSVNDELDFWSVTQKVMEPDGLQDERLAGLYRRAVYFYAKADLVERYRDLDITDAGDRRADDKEGVADDARRNMRWAIRDILGLPRTTVEAL